MKNSLLLNIINPKWKSQVNILLIQFDKKELKFWTYCLQPLLLQHLKTGFKLIVWMTLCKSSAQKVTEDRKSISYTVWPITGKVYTKMKKWNSVSALWSTRSNSWLFGGPIHWVKTYTVEEFEDYTNLPAHNRFDLKILKENQLELEPA